jgi:hypothetical protein
MLRLHEMNFKFDYIGEINFIFKQILGMNQGTCRFVHKQVGKKGEKNNFLSKISRVFVSKAPYC